MQFNCAKNLKTSIVDTKLYMCECVQNQKIQAVSNLPNYFIYT